MMISLHLSIVLACACPYQSETTPIPPAEREAVEACLRAYDAAWKEGDAEKALALFCAKSPCRTPFREEVGSFLNSHRMTSCRSSLEFLGRSNAGPQIYWGAYVHSELGYLPKDSSNAEETFGAFEHMLELDHFLLLRADKDRATILRVEEFDPTLLGVLKSDKVGCPACNYELARPAGWFVLPRGRGWSPCTDSLSMLHPTGRVQADFDILECQKNQDLAAIASSDENDLASSCAMTAQKLKSSARKQLSLGENQQGLEVEGTVDRSGEETPLSFLRVYYLQGPVLYTLNVYGDADVFAAHRAEIDFLRRSFKIADPKLSLADLRDSMKSRHNPGGKIEKTLYTNQQYGVRVQGPNGWKTEDYSGATLFLVRFLSPENPEIHMSFHAIEDPNGWPDEESVRRTLEKHVGKASQLTPSPVQAKRYLHRGLQAFAYEAQWRSLGEKPMQHEICMLPAGQVLYVLELAAPADRFEAQRKLFRSVLDSLSRF